MPWTRTYDEAEPQRVNRWLAQSGVCSRREAETLIAEGRVSIDGQVVEDAGRKIEPGQTLTVADTGEGPASALSPGGPLLANVFSLLIHKPVGVVSAQPEGKQIPAARLLTGERLWGPPSPIPDQRASLPPLGRLDMDSRGLLILSQDGVLAKALIGPQSVLDKEYLVQVDGLITPRKIAMLRHGLSLDGRELKPAKVNEIGNQRLRIVLNEGRNRQIRRMCDLVELRVVDLFRTRIGPLRLRDLPEGRWRPLTAEERMALITGQRVGG